ncbi:unnamed protein product [Staurois parvus]|uniref:Uncharacterized protein n=1 Tax=Staurois parvus TaxID=386267 RepID=A0ABN9H7U9_9NEOB|nr:unnamed protein product [Staurois parvus]
MFTSVRFQPVRFLERVRDFLNAKSCVFGSIDFNGNAGENVLWVLHFKSA